MGWGWDPHYSIKEMVSNSGREGVGRHQGRGQNFIHPEDGG